MKQTHFLYSIATIVLGSIIAIFVSLKCIRLFRPQFSKVKTSFVVEIR